MKKIVVGVVCVVVLAAAVFWFKGGKSTKGAIREAQRAAREVQREIQSEVRANVVDVSGDVELTRADGRTVKAAKNMSVGQGDRLATSSNGRCTIEFENGAAAALGAETKLAVDLMDKKLTARLFTCKLKLDAGKILMDVPKGPTRKSEVTVLTPSGALGVRGTRFMAAVDSVQTTRVAVYEGVVEVTAKGKTVAVSANQGALVKMGEAPAEPVAILAAPAVLAPAKEERIAAETITVRFKPVPDAKRYLVQLARNPQGTYIAAEVATDKPSAQLPGPATDGPYYLIVRAVNALDLPGGPSAARTIFYLFHSKSEKAR